MAQKKTRSTTSGIADNYHAFLVVRDMRVTKFTSKPASTLFGVTDGIVQVIVLVVVTSPVSVSDLEVCQSQEVAFHVRSSDGIYSSGEVNKNHTSKRQARAVP